MKLLQTPHRRLNPLTREWVLVSPQRLERPWQGQVEKIPAAPSQSYDPHCYLCPGNQRSGGIKNPKYTSTYAFTNDFAALIPASGSAPSEVKERGIIVARSEAGTSRVICFSPRHDLTLSRMKVEDIRDVVDVWADEYTQLGGQSDIGYVQIFENRGEIMGCSNAHPHGQIWASATIPNEPRKEESALSAYQREGKGCILCDYLKLESQLKERIVSENEHFVAAVPFWAIWPFEIIVISKAHARDMSRLSGSERLALAEILNLVTIRYDNLFETSFPYSMGFHQAPTDGGPHPEWHLHAHFYPPLLRSATIRKFMVGYEMLAEPQRDLTPELAAERLRMTSTVHYAQRNS